MGRLKRHVCTHALIASIAQHSLFFAVQQRMGLDHVGHIACRADNRVHQAGSHADTYMRLHAEVTVVVLLRLVHRRIALLVVLLCRRRRGDQGRSPRPEALPVNASVPTWFENRRPQVLMSEN